MEQTKTGPRTIVSLTSFPGAIDYAPGAILSMLKGSVRPDKLVLYVTKSQFEGQPLPEAIREIEREYPNFEVRDYPRDIRSYRKLVPALRDFPDDIIVTIDDDVDYHPDMLAELLKAHERYPEDIIAHRTKRVKPGAPYKKWKKYRWYHFLLKRWHRRYDTMQTGVAGVLYPPGVLKKEMIDDDLFTRLSPTADDIWFWAAAVANGRKVTPVPFGRNKPKGLGKPRHLSLKWGNFKSGVDRNRQQFEAILAEYPEIKARLAEE